MIVTKAQLIAKGACASQVTLFGELFGESVEVTKEGCAAVADKFGPYSWDWAANSLLAPPLLRRYERAATLICAQFNRELDPIDSWYQSSAAPIWERYERAASPIHSRYWKESFRNPRYERALRPIQAQRDKKLAPLKAQYERQVAPIRTRHCKALASVWARLALKQKR